MAALLPGERRAAQLNRALQQKLQQVLAREDPARLRREIRLLHTSLRTTRKRVRTLEAQLQEAVGRGQTLQRRLAEQLQHQRALEAHQRALEADTEFMRGVAQRSMRQVNTDTLLDAHEAAAEDLRELRRMLGPTAAKT